MGTSAVTCWAALHVSNSGVMERGAPETCELFCHGLMKQHQPIMSWEGPTMSGMRPSALYNGVHT